MAHSEYVAYDGRVVFQTRHLSIKALRDLDRYREMAEASKHWIIEDSPRFATEAAQLLVCTVDVIFDPQGDEQSALLHLIEGWQTIQDAKGDTKRVIAMLDFLGECSTAVLNTWFEAINAANLPHFDPTSAPPELLKAGQADDDFLELSAPDGDKESENASDN